MKSCKIDSVGCQELEQVGDVVVSAASIACDGERTLVVDDEAAILRLFRTVFKLEIPGVIVDVALNGLQAVDSFVKNHQAVLVMDINMPVMDGQAAFHEIEKLCRERNWNMPAVVFCTGYAPPDLMKEVGGSRHCVLLKPSNYMAVADAVRLRLNQAVA